MQEFYGAFESFIRDSEPQQQDSIGPERRAPASGRERNVAADNAGSKTGRARNRPPQTIMPRSPLASSALACCLRTASRTREDPLIPCTGISSRPKRRPSAHDLLIRFCSPLSAPYNAYKAWGIGSGRFHDHADCRSQRCSGFAETCSSVTRGCRARFRAASTVWRFCCIRAETAASRYSIRYTRRKGCRKSLKGL